MRPLILVPLALLLQAPLAPVNVRLTTGGVGPQPSITCPAGATRLKPGMNLPAAVSAATARSFCFEAGVHALAGAIVPKSGDTFIGEYGAILDGSGWQTSDPLAAAFLAHNQDIDDVTIRNVVIRNMPQRGIQAFKDFSDRWTVENVEIGPTKGTAINLPNDSALRFSYVHDNAIGGYAAYQSNRVLFEGNEFTRNGNESKIAANVGTVFRNNFVHHNVNGLWADGDNIDTLYEGNRIEDNSGNGIQHEVSGRAVIRNNRISRNGDSAGFISTSRDVDVYGNVVTDNARAFNLFVSCAALAEKYAGIMARDLSGNSVHDNTITVPSKPDSFANLLNAASDCTPEQAAAIGFNPAAYTNGSKGNVFDRNRYQVPSLSGLWFFWQGLKSWPDWQAASKEASGSVSLRP